MSFEILKPKMNKKKLKGLIISITKSHVTLSKDLAADWPENCGYIQIFLDKTKKLLGMKPRKNNDAFSITLSKNKKTESRYFQSKILLENGINLGKVNMNFDRKSGMYIGSFPDGSKIDGVITKDT
jgi:hypothetical protein